MDARTHAGQYKHIRMNARTQNQTQSAEYCARARTYTQANVVQASTWAHTHKVTRLFAHSHELTAKSEPHSLNPTNPLNQRVLCSRPMLCCRVDYREWKFTHSRSLVSTHFAIDTLFEIDDLFACQGWTHSKFRLFPTSDVCVLSNDYWRRVDGHSKRLLCGSKSSP